MECTLFGKSRRQMFILWGFNQQNSDGEWLYSSWFFSKESGKEKKKIKEIWGMSTNHKVWALFGFWLNKLSRRNDTYEEIRNFTHLFKDNNQLIIIVWLCLLKLSLSDSEICMDDMTWQQICFIMIWSWEMDEFMSLMNWQLLKLGGYMGVDLIMVSILVC